MRRNRFNIQGALVGLGVLVLLLGWVTAGPAFAEIPAGADEQEEAEASEEEPDSEEDADGQQQRRPGFGGPNQVENQIMLEEIEKPLLQRWADWKSGLVENKGLSFGIDYSAVYLGASDSPGEDSASSGMVRFFGSWYLIGRKSGNTGAFVWKVEHRHAYSDVPPGSFGFEIGYVGLFEPPFSDQGLRLTNLYWRQRLLQGRVALIGGWVDVTDYLDVYALASPWTGFMNFVFSTGSATMALPNEGIGLAAGGMITDKFFAIGGLADSNSDPTDPGDGFDTFFDVREYFKHIEFGWTPSQDQIYLDNVHISFWHADEREAALTPDGWGANFSFSRYLGKKWLPFVRAGYADDGGSLLEKSVSAGFGYQRVQGKNLLGLGLNWGRPSASSFEPGLDDQYTVELFYRWNISREITLTPDLQYLKDPALNPDESSIWVFGLRARLAL